MPRLRFLCCEFPDPATTVYVCPKHTKIGGQFTERNTMQAPPWRETFHVLSMQFPTMGTLLSKLQCEIQMFICTINSSHHSAAGKGFLCDFYGNWPLFAKI